jgi:thymidylate synthase (FAD)
MKKIDVLDKGYVILHDVLGNDLTVANSARVSYNKRTETLTERDESLINFLAREGHTSPFRHATLQFEVYAPLMVARQWWKYVVGSDHVMDAWNESSRRYVTEEPEFHIPDADMWRSIPVNSKQGSGDYISIQIGSYWTEKLAHYQQLGHELYEQAMCDNICAEQARLFLPAYGLYVRWYWTASLASVAHLLNQRLAHDAQKEFQFYAQAVNDLAIEHFPISIKALMENV